MNVFLEVHQEVLKSLLTHNVSFMLVGGYAVNYYGYNRMTGDLDLWIEPENANKLLLLEAMRDLGFDEKGISTLNKLDFRQAQLFSILERPFQVEFMTHISGVKFEEAKRYAIFVEIDEVLISIIHFNDLITNKLTTGRPQDMVDVEQLRKIQNFRGE